jgi:hypothetical protein
LYSSAHQPKASGELSVYFYDTILAHELDMVARHAVFDGECIHQQLREFTDGYVEFAEKCLASH